MVDDDGGRQGGEEVPKLRQIDGLEIDDDVPAELGDAPGDLHQLVFRGEVDQALDEIEADAADAGVMERLKLVVRNAAPHGRHAARAPAARNARVDHGAVVGAVAGRLHDHVA